MVFGFKYHIFTITAIFAALGIGILIGTSLIGDDMFIQEQERLINNIKNNIQQINEENINLKSNIDDLKEELNYRKEMEKKILSMLINEQFPESKYLLYTDHEFVEYEKKIKEIGLDLKIIEDFEILEEIEKYSKLIMWETDGNDKSEVKGDIKEKIFSKEIDTIFYDKPDLIGLIITIMESEIND